MSDIPRINELATFMKKRQNIYLKRKDGAKPPWTDDPILQTGRFCNVFREQDTVTIWIEENIRKPYADHPNLWFMLCIARYINWPPTLAALIELAEKNKVPCWPSHSKFDCGEVYTKSHEGQASDLTWGLTQLANSGTKVYTGAYMIRAESNPKVEWYSWSKHKYLTEIVLGRLWEDREDWQRLLESVPRLEEVWWKFQAKRYIGWGPFMAYEVVTDLRHTRYLNKATDIVTWANAGPGAIRGLNRMHGRDLKNHPKAEVTNLEMYRIMAHMNHDQELWPRHWSRLEMRDIEHVLCEWDKYERVRLNEGQMRAKYDASKATKLC